MTPKQISEIVYNVCNAEEQCPVFRAYGNTGDDCFMREECPLKEALMLYQDIKCGKKKLDIGD